jgi:GDP-L-fucose synthase
MRDQELVLHLAAAKGGGIVHSMTHHGSLFRDNLTSFINVLDVARAQSVSRFLVVSSACVYPRDAGVPAPEEDGCRGVPEPTNAGYGWSKRMEEYMALAFHQEFGMNLRIARPFNAYGPRDDFFRDSNHVIPGLITRVFSGESPLVVWGTGKQTRTFLYATDFARGLLEVCAQDKTIGPVNLGSEEEVSIGDLARLIVELSGSKVDIVFDASRPDGQPRRTCDVTKAKRLVGFEAKVPLEQGLASTIAWYQRERDRRGVNR